MQNITESTMLPCTALAVKKIIESLEMKTVGLNAVVIGRSHNVGLPISIILGADISKGGFDMTTVSCHRATAPKQLVKACRRADIIVSAAGVPGLVNPDMVKPGAVLIDVGLNRHRTNDGKDIVIGDMTKDVRKVASVVTPVPGGVGPCTVACLMLNTLKAAVLQTQAAVVNKSNLETAVLQTEAAIEQTNAAVEQTNAAVEQTNATVEQTNAAVEHTNAAVEQTKAAVQNIKDIR